LLLPLLRWRAPRWTAQGPPDRRRDDQPHPPPTPLAV